MNSLPSFARLSLEQEPTEMPAKTRSQSQKSLLDDLPEALLQEIIELILKFAQKEGLFDEMLSKDVGWKRTMQKRDTPCQAIINLCATSKTAFPFCSNAEFWKQLCKKIPSYKDPPKKKAYKGEEELKYWKRRFDAWCRGRALVDSEGFDQRNVRVGGFQQILALRQNEKVNELRRAVREYMQRLDKWNRGGVVTHHSFGPIEEWYVEDVTDMSYLFSFYHMMLWAPHEGTFRDARSRFNPCLNKWDTSNVTNMQGMFMGCQKFNNGDQSISFDTSSTVNFAFMFVDCRNLNVPVEFNTKEGKIMTGMFLECSKFNQTIEFDFSKAQYFNEMFRSCKKFNNGAPANSTDKKPLVVKPTAKVVVDFQNPQLLSYYSALNTTAYDYTLYRVKMNNMFQDCRVFNQTCKFETSLVGQMENMFSGCTAFNNGGVPFEFDTKLVRSFENMFMNCVNLDQPCSVARGRPKVNMGWKFVQQRMFQWSSATSWPRLKSMFRGCPKIAAQRGQIVWQLPGLVVNPNPDILFRAS